MKVTSGLIITLFLIITILSIKNVAQPPTIIKGHVYIDYVITAPDEVHLTF